MNKIEKQGMLYVLTLFEEPNPIITTLEMNQISKP